MPTVASRSITIERSNVKEYVTAHNLTLDTAYLGNDCAFRSAAKTGYATLNAAAKAILFPNAAAKPVKADSTMQIGASSNSSNNYVELQFGGTAVHHQLCSNANETKTGLTNAAITGAAQGAEIRYMVHINNLFVAAIVTHVSLSLYFKRYVCAAMTAGSGVTSATVSDAEPWDGDSVTFTATLAAGAAFDGWYSDAACTQRVSTELSYTATAADLTLYAKATKATGTGIYLKRAGAQVQAAAVWKKENGLWVKADKTAIDAGKNYRIVQR